MNAMQREWTGKLPEATLPVWIITRPGADQLRAH